MLPINLRLLFASKISHIYSQDEVKYDYKLFLHHKEEELLAYKDYATQFTPSFTSQLLLNFVTEKEQKEFIKSFSSSSKFKEGKGKYFQDILYVFYYILNEKPENKENIVNDFYENLIPKYKEVSFKNFYFQVICQNLENINSLNLYYLKNIFKKNPEILEEKFLKEFEKDKLLTSFIITAKDIYEYSNKTLPNSSIPIVSYVYYQKRIKELLSRK